MFTWLKNLFSGTSVPEVINSVTKEEPIATKKKTTKKKTNKTCDFDKLTKAQLLKEAKHRGIKANASLTKAEILKRVKNG